MYGMDGPPSRGGAGYSYYDAEAGHHHHDPREYDEDDKHKKRRSQTLPLALKWAVVVCLAWGVLMMTLGLAGTGTGTATSASVNTLTPGARLVEQGMEQQKPAELHRQGQQQQELDEQQLQELDEQQLQEQQPQPQPLPPPAKSEVQTVAQQTQEEEERAQQQQEREQQELLLEEQERQLAEQKLHHEHQHEPPASGDGKRQDEAAGVEAEIETLKSSWEDRMSSGRELLLTGVDLALQELMATRGQRPPANTDELLGAATTPDFGEAIEVVERAATMFARSYTGEIEIIERDYVGAMTTLALLRLYQGQFDEMYALLDEAKTRIDLDPEENAMVALLQGYMHEAQGSEKAGMFFTLAREYDPVGCHESLLDASYQPPDYQLSVHMPSESPAYWPALADLLVFRELYARRAISSPAATWPGSVWSKSPQNDADEYGANLGWGLNTQGVAKAATLLQTQDFVILREFLHPFELAVLERHYKAKVQTNQLSFDTDLGRATSYQDRVGHWLNHRMTQLLSTVAGRSVKHAYSFLCHYEKRDGVTPWLKAHTDREDNEITVSIQIYGDKERPAWPIYVQTQPTLPERSSWRPQPADTAAVQCDIHNGDALVFLGRRHIHYRHPMPEELSLVSSLLLHYVDKTFDFYDYKIVRQRRDSSI